MMNLNKKEINKMEKLNQNTSKDFVGYEKEISYELDNKTFLQKILTIGMKSCINSYVEHKHKRDKARTVLEEGAGLDAVVHLAKFHEINLMNLNRFKASIFLITLVLDILLVVYLSKLPLFQNYELSTIFTALIIMFLPFALSMKLGGLQCKLLLNEFRKIDEISAIEDLMEEERNLKILQEKEELKRNKTACNLYLK